LRLYRMADAEWGEVEARGKAKGRGLGCAKGPSVTLVAWLGRPAALLASPAAQAVTIYVIAKEGGIFHSQPNDEEAGFCLVGR
jgi:hypothetical protein